MWATSRLIAPPFPDASHPSNTTHTGGPKRCSPNRPPTVSRSWVRRPHARSRPRASSWRVSDLVRSSSSSRPTARILSDGAGLLGAIPEQVEGDWEQERGEEDHHDPHH